MLKTNGGIGVTRLRAGLPALMLIPWLTVAAAFAEETETGSDDPPEETVTTESTRDQALDACREAMAEIQTNIYGGSTGHAYFGIAHADLRKLREAARIFARNGVEVGCTEIADGLHELAENRLERVEDMAEAQSDEQRIAGATPVTEIAMNLRVSDVVGSEVVNSEYEDLGTVEEIFVRPNGDRYLVVSRGGVMWIGMDYIAIPMNRARVTQDRLTFVVDIAPDALEGAPTVDQMDEDSPMPWFESVDDWWLNEGGG